MSVRVDLKGKNILITGANGSIGLEIFLKFIEADANCICLDKSFHNLKKIKLKKKI